MRSVLLVVLAAVLAGPALAQAGEPAQEPVLDKIRLQQLEPDAVIRLLSAGPPPALPAGIDSVVGFTPDNSVIVRGRPEAVASLRSAVEVIDAPVVGGSLTVTLRRADPDTVRAAALELPGAGEVHRVEASIRFQGAAEWLEAARGLVLRAELEAPLSEPRRAGELVLTLPPGVTFDVVAPDGRRLAERLPEGAAAGPVNLHFQRPVRLLFSNGMEIQAGGVSAVVLSLEPPGGARLHLRLAHPGQELEARLPPGVECTVNGRPVRGADAALRTGAATYFASGRDLRLVASDGVVAEVRGLTTVLRGASPGEGVRLTARPPGER